MKQKWMDFDTYNILQLILFIVDKVTILQMIYNAYFYCLPFYLKYIYWQLAIVEEILIILGNVMVIN